MRGQYSRSLGANQHEFNKHEARAYTAGTDPIGYASEHEGLFNHLRTNFVGWKDQPLTASGDIAEGARVFLASDMISTAFPNGLTADSKLYAIYVTTSVPSLDDWGTAISWAVNDEETGPLKALANSQVKPQLNSDIEADAVLPTTQVEVALSDASSGRIIDTYQKKDDDEQINEVVFHSSFSMNPRVAMLVYSNPAFGYGNLSPNPTPNPPSPGNNDDGQNPPDNNGSSQNQPGGGQQGGRQQPAQTIPHTGDASHLGWYFALTLACLLAGSVAVLVAVRKRAER